MDKYAVIGNPVAHSLSPEIQTMFAQQTQQQLSYTKIQAPLDGFEQTLRDFIANGGKGCNVTLPFKEQAYNIVDSLSERAQLAQAVNTIVLQKDGQLYGDNTDGVGLVRDITQNIGITIGDKRVLLLGAGGAARGVIAPLLNEKPSELIIANRTVEKAELLVQAFDQLGTIASSSFSELGGSFDIIINATSASVKGASLPLNPAIVTNLTLCYDMMYGQNATPFLIWAQKAHAGKTVDGFGMLVEQAAESFALWRGVTPDTSTIRERIFKHI